MKETRWGKTQEWIQDNCNVILRTTFSGCQQHSLLASVTYKPLLQSIICISSALLTLQCSRLEEFLQKRKEKRKARRLEQQQEVRHQDDEWERTEREGRSCTFPAPSCFPLSLATSTLPLPKCHPEYRGLLPHSCTYLLLSSSCHWNLLRCTQNFHTSSPPSLYVHLHDSEFYSDKFMYFSLVLPTPYVSSSRNCYLKSSFIFNSAKDFMALN